MAASSSGTSGHPTSDRIGDTSGEDDDGQYKTMPLDFNNDLTKEESEFDQKPTQHTIENRTSSSKSRDNKLSDKITTKKTDGGDAHKNDDKGPQHTGEGKDVNAKTASGKADEGPEHREEGKAVKHKVAPDDAGQGPEHNITGEGKDVKFKGASGKADDGPKHREEGKDAKDTVAQDIAGEGPEHNITGKGKDVKAKGTSGKADEGPKHREEGKDVKDKVKQDDASEGPEPREEEKNVKAKGVSGKATKVPEQREEGKDVKDKVEQDDAEGPERREEGKDVKGKVAQDNPGKGPEHNVTGEGKDVKAKEASGNAGCGREVYSGVTGGDNTRDGNKSGNHGHAGQNQSLSGSDESTLRSDTRSPKKLTGDTYGHSPGVPDCDNTVRQGTHNENTQGIDTSDRGTLDGDSSKQNKWDRNKGTLEHCGSLTNPLGTATSQEEGAGKGDTPPPRPPKPIMPEGSNISTQGTHNDNTQGTSDCGTLDNKSTDDDSGKQNEWGGNEGTEEDQNTSEGFGNPAIRIGTSNSQEQGAGVGAEAPPLPRKEKQPNLSTASDLPASDPPPARPGRPSKDARERRRRPSSDRKGLPADDDARERRRRPSSDRKGPPADDDARERRRRPSSDRKGPPADDDARESQRRPSSDRKGPQADDDARERQRRPSSDRKGPQADDDEHLKVEVVIESKENDEECREYLEHVPVNVEDYLKLQFIRNNPILVEHTQRRHGQVAVNKNNKLKVFLNKALDDSDNAVLARTFLKDWIANDTRLFVSSIPIGQLCPKHLIPKLLELDMAKKNQLFVHYTKVECLLNYVCMKSESRKAHKIISDSFKKNETKCEWIEDTNPEETEMMQQKMFEERADVTKLCEFNLVFQEVLQDELNIDIGSGETVESVALKKFKTRVIFTPDVDSDLLNCQIVGTQDMVDETDQWLHAHITGYFQESLNFGSIQHTEALSAYNISSMLKEFFEDEEKIEELESEVQWNVNDKARTASLCSRNQDKMQTLKKKAMKCVILESVIVKCNAKDVLDGIMKDLSEEKLQCAGKVVVTCEANKMDVVGLKKHVENVIAELKSKRDTLLGKLCKISDKKCNSPPSSTVTRPVILKVSCQEGFDFLLKTADIEQEVTEKFGVKVKRLAIQEKFGFLLEGSSDDVGNAADYLGSVAYQTVDVYTADEEKLHKVIAFNEKVKAKVSDTSNTQIDMARWSLNAGHELKLSPYETRNCWKELLVEQLVTTTKEDTKPVIQNLQGQRKKIQLNVPSIEGKEIKKEKHDLGEGFDHILEEAKAHDCSHVCLSLEPIGGWQPDKFLKTILPSIQNLATAECIPMTVEMCVVGSQMYSRCKSVITDALRREPDGEPCTASGSPPMKSEELHVDIVSGELSKTPVDVIVNSTSKELQLDSGAISKSLLQAAGHEIQKEIKINYPRGIVSGEVAETSSFKLPCQRVFHCVIEPFQYSKYVKPIEEIVSKCLHQADAAGFKSIAFPALGTGNLGYPKNKVAEAMLTVIRDFVGDSLREVKIVIYTKDTETYQKFMDVEKTASLRASTKTRTPDIVLGKLILHANVGPLSQVQADSLIYLWDKNYMYNVKVKDHKVLKEMPQEVQQFSRHRESKTNRYKILTTFGGNVRVKRVFHIPCDRNDLQAALTQGLQKADVGQSAVIFFESTHTFLVCVNKLGECIVQTISSVSPSLKNLRRVVVNLETNHSAAKVIECFKSNIQPSKSMPAEKRQFTVMIGGPKDEVEKLKTKLKALEDDQDDQVSGQSLQSEPGPMSMGRSLTDEGMKEEYYSNDAPHKQPAATRRQPKPVNSVKYTIDTYVEIHTVPDGHENEAKLKQVLFVSGFPICPPVVVFAEKMKRAVLICKTKKEVSKLCKFTGCKDISFQPVPQITNHSTLRVESGRFEELTKDKQFDLKKALEDAQIELFIGDTCLLKAPTLCQIAYGQSLLKEYGLFDNDKWNEEKQNSESETILLLPDMQFIVFESKVREMNKQIVENWTLHEMKDGKIAITLHPKHESSKDMIIEIEDWLKSISVDEVHCSDKDVVKFCKEIEADNKVPCCMYDQRNKRCVIYHESYQELQKVKHQLNVKLGNVKITGRRKRDFTDANTAVEPLSQEASTPTFDWQKVKSIQFYNAPGNIQVLVYVASIVELTVDCIVNAANDILQHGGGVAKVIAKAAGRKLDEECSEYKRKKGKVPVGGNCVTTAGNLPCRRVIHAVGPRWSDYRPHDFTMVRQCEDHLYNAVFSSLEAAEKEKLKSIALPAISSAIFGVPEEICVYYYAKATLDYCRKAQGTSLKEIHFVDIKSDIISEIQKMFDLMVNDGKDPGNDTQKFVKRFPPSQYPSGQGSRDYPIGQNARNYPTGQGTGGDLKGQGSRDYPLGQDTRNYPTGQGTGGYPKGQGSRDYPTGQDTRIESAARRQNPVVIGNIHVQKANVFSVNAKGAAIVIYIDRYGLVHGQMSDQVFKRINNYGSYKSELSNKLHLYPQSCVTRGYGCGYDYILHVVTENYQALTNIKEKKLKIGAAYENVFNTAYYVKKVNAVILTLIGTGTDDRDLSISVEAFKDSFDKMSIQYVDHTPLDVHLVVNSDKKVDEVCKRFSVNPVSTGHNGRDRQLKVKDTTWGHGGSIQETSPHRDGNNRADIHGTSQDNEYEQVGNVAMDTRNQTSADDNCVICMDTFDAEVTTLECGHTFCTGCIDQQFKVKKACPTCGRVCGIITGDQPEGSMNVNFYSTSLAGYEGCGSIWISYNFPHGKQGPNHPNPGTRYRGFTRIAYLPDNQEGREVCDMLKVAFDRKLVFTIGHSRTTGQEGVITWNDIHHKTDMRQGSQFGYPDETYLTRVREELAAKGVTTADIGATRTQLY